MLTMRNVLFKRRGNRIESLDIVLEERGITRDLLLRGTCLFLSGVVVGLILSTPQIVAVVARTWQLLP